MSGVNKAILVGRLGKDPEVRNLENGTTVVNFSMATSETYRDRTTGEKREITEWHNVVLWRGLAEVAAKYLHKGDMVYIEGRLRTRSWEREGVTRYTTEIHGDNMTMLSGRSDSSDAGGSPGNYQAQSPGMSAQPSAQSQPTQSPSVSEPDVSGGSDAPDDDLPF